MFSGFVGGDFFFKMDGILRDGPICIFSKGMPLRFVSLFLSSSLPFINVGANESFHERK